MNWSVNICQCGVFGFFPHPMPGPDWIVPHSGRWGWEKLLHKGRPNFYYGHGERLTTGDLWHGNWETFHWEEDRWLGFGAKLTTADERERDIRWKNDCVRRMRPC